MLEFLLMIIFFSNVLIGFQIEFIMGCSGVTSTKESSSNVIFINWVNYEVFIFETTLEKPVLVRT